ncbi:Hypothetical protein CINCED_3A015411 [Cinara cedri]|uniref:Uncharacterized protein n=1 Tax=Cinara cedri TaxID=506608 RepID=A0A5E4MGH4_9HEMI|nr:Hypothetical protein CINCED_3A015411 [Cinara cedri]
MKEIYTGLRAYQARILQPGLWVPAQRRNSMFTPVALVVTCGVIGIYGSRSARIVDRILPKNREFNNKHPEIVDTGADITRASKLITVVEKNDQKRKRLLEDVRSQSVRIANRCDAFVDHIPEGDKDADFNVTVFRNRTVEQVLADNSRYGFHNAYRVCVSKYIEYKNLLKCDDSFGGVKTTSKKVVKEFNNRTRTVWLTLMSHEDILSQEITKMIGELRDVFEKYMTEFKQLVDNRFIILQRQQSIFLQFILEYAVSSAQSDDIHNRSHKVSQITNDISECMESQALQVNHAGCYIIKRASKWLTDLFKNLKNEEIQRNRRKMLEIATFVHYQEESFKKILF